MRRSVGSVMFGLTALVIFLFPAVLPAQAPEKLAIGDSGGIFQVKLTNHEGVEVDLFNKENPLHYDITFVQQKTNTAENPVTITLTQESGGKAEETVIWQGTLTEPGVYLYRHATNGFPVTSGTVNAKVVVKTRVFRDKATKDSTFDFKTWEGSYKVGWR